MRELSDIFDVDISKREGSVIGEPGFIDLYFMTYPR